MKPDTQLQAYNDITQSKAGILRARVKVTLKGLDFGATSEELAALMKEDYSSVQPRTSELHEALQIFDTGKRRKNQSGKNAIVWQLVETDEQRELAVKQTLKKMKPIGDAKLFGEFMRSVYALAAQDTPENYDNYVYASSMWEGDMVKRIRKTKFSNKDATE